MSQSVLQYAGGNQSIGNINIITGQHLTKPGVAACPPDPCLAHTVTVVCMGGTLSGSSPENKNEPLNCGLTLDTLLD